MEGSIGNVDIEHSPPLTRRRTAAPVHDAAVGSRVRRRLPTLDAIELVPQRQLGIGLLVAAIILGAGLRFWLALHDDGIYWPDEIYQSLEPAHHLVTGYAILPWEFVRGARTWAFPGVIAGVMLVAQHLGFTQPRQYVAFIHVALAAWSIAATPAVYWLARTQGAGPVAAGCGAVAYALLAPSIYFGHRGLAESFSVLPVVLGMALALRHDTRRRWVMLGALCLGAATLIRLQNGLFCVGLLAILLGRREYHHMLLATAVLGVCAVGYGAFDWLTWGSWFHSAILYISFNASPKVARYGVQAWYYYLDAFGRSAMPASVPLALLVLAAWRRAPGLSLIVLANVVLFSATPHKELRFLFPAIALGCAVAAVGLESLRDWGRPRLFTMAATVTLVTVAISASGFRSLTFSELGNWSHLARQTSAYDQFGPVNRLLFAAHDRADLCGLRLDGRVSLTWTGGYTYLDRRVPVYAWPQLNSPSPDMYNYAIAERATGPLGRVVATDGVWELRALDRQCVPDPNWVWELDGDPLAPAAPPAVSAGS